MSQYNWQYSVSWNVIYCCENSWIFSIITPVSRNISEYYQYWKQLYCFIFLWSFFMNRKFNRIAFFFKIEMYCNIINVFIVTFDQFNVSLLNKSIKLVEYILTFAFSIALGVSIRHQHFHFITGWITFVSSSFQRMSCSASFSSSVGS